MSAGDFSSPDGSRLASRRVSVLIPVYKGEAFVARAVQSALNQSFPDVEVVIVNDGSPDDSRRVLEPFLSLPNVRYVEKPNGGVASARNAGLRVATGCYVALLDQDDAWLPHKLERQVALLESRPEVALVHADVTYDGPDDGVLPHDPHRLGRVSKHVSECSEHRHVGGWQPFRHRPDVTVTEPAEVRQPGVA